MGYDGKVAIVTGAGRGLGRDYAQSFAGEGARVVVADINADDAQHAAAELERDGAEAVAVTVDVSDEASVLAMADAVRERFGRADILVNNAGIWGDLERHKLLEIPTAYWDTVLGVNLRGPLLCTRAVAPLMRKRGWGRVVNISSMGAYMVSGVYGVSKLALNQLTYALASELGADGITVNAVAPGTIANEASRRQVPDGAFERLVNASIIKRTGTSADLFGMIRYLTSDDAEWVTGQTFLVNGGYNTRL
jgi:NAD(P)-dependent dehydrogenase (short-subunit alcohol dehydrogenase family)